MLWLEVGCFCRNPNIGNGVALTFLPTLGTLLLLSGYLIQTPYKGFCLIVSYYVGLCLLEVCSFLKGNGGEVDMEDSGGGGKL